MTPRLLKGPCPWFGTDGIDAVPGVWEINTFLGHWEKKWHNEGWYQGKAREVPRHLLAFPSPLHHWQKGHKSTTSSRVLGLHNRQGGNYHDHLDEIQYSTLGQAAFIGVYLMFKVFSCLDFKKFGSHWNSMNVCPLTHAHIRPPPTVPTRSMHVPEDAEQSFNAAGLQRGDKAGFPKAVGEGLIKVTTLQHNIKYLIALKSSG